MRHDLAAFRELDTLVRNLSDQLAGYRKRALSAELRVRELEKLTDELRTTATKTHDRAEVLGIELDAVSGALRAEQDAGVVARTMVHDLSRAAAEAARVEEGTQPSASERALARDNVELRRRLEEAAARTRELSDRLKFLRQQLTTVQEK